MGLKGVEGGRRRLKGVKGGWRWLAGDKGVKLVSEKDGYMNSVPKFFFTGILPSSQSSRLFTIF